MLTTVKSWLTFHLVKLAAQLDGELFMRLCEVAMRTKYKDAIKAAEEAMRDVIRLEQEHDYDYNFEENYNDTTKPTTH